MGYVEQVGCFSENSENIILLSNLSNTCEHPLLTGFLTLMLNFLTISDRVLTARGWRCRLKQDKYTSSTSHRKNLSPPTLPMQWLSVPSLGRLMRRFVALFPSCLSCTTDICSRSLHTVAPFLLYCTALAICLRGQTSNST